MTYEELLAENFHLRARIRELEQEIAGLRGSTKLHQITQNCIGGSFTAAHPMQLKC